MFLVYIAGPYSGATREIIEQNIQTARLYAAKLSELGIGFVCPHLNTAHFGEVSKAPEIFYYHLGLEILSRCDAMLVIPYWKKSKGTNMEIDFAFKKEIPTFFADSFNDFRGLIEYFKSKGGQNGERRK